MYVYFMGIEGFDAVKIGKANDPAKRLSLFQTGNPFRLDILLALRCTNPMRPAEVVERSYHELLDHLRIRGEWFHLSDEVSALLGCMDEGDMDRADRIVKVIRWQSARQARADG